MSHADRDRSYDQHNIRSKQQPFESIELLDAHGKCQHKPEHHVKKLIPFYQLIQHGQRLSFDDPILQIRPQIQRSCYQTASDPQDF